MNDDDDSPKPKEALANASVAKLRKLAEKNPDDSLLNDVARNVEESVRAIDSAEVAVAQVRQELKRRAEVMEGLKEEEKKLAATMNQKLPIEDNFVAVPQAAEDGNPAAIIEAEVGFHADGFIRIARVPTK